MRVKMVCLEDGITSCGFRKMAAYATRLNPGSEAHYVSTNDFRTVGNFIRGTLGMTGELDEDGVDEIAQGLASSDVIGFSSMTGYAGLTRRVISRIREINPSAYMIWGGIHPIIHPEDAIQADVDAICTGEGEFAFEELCDLLQEGRDFTGVKNFWFKTANGNGNGIGDGNGDGKVIRNDFLPLMTNEELDTLPYPQYGAPGEKIYSPGRGFVPLTKADYLRHFGVNYDTVWSIGCPFHCSFCGNTKFIANDPKYKRIRHSSARHIVEEVKAVRQKFPFVSQVNFHDDSFMAITYRELEEFAELWHEELDVPFVVYGVIPNYVKEEKFEILTWAGMRGIRMGIQSGSQQILDFYKRPTPPARIMEAGDVIGKFSAKYHSPPAYDIIVDNPIETRQDVLDTLELLYKMKRPYTLNIYSLKIIPNTELERAMSERGVDLDGISSSYAVIPPRIANLMLYVLVICRPPRWAFDIMLRWVRASTEEQKMFPRLGFVLRAAYVFKRASDRLRRFDLTPIPGKAGYFLWRSGITGYFEKRRPRLPRPVKAARKPVDIAARIPVVEAEVG